MKPWIQTFSILVLGIGMVSAAHAQDSTQAYLWVSRITPEQDMHLTWNGRQLRIYSGPLEEAFLVYDQSGRLERVGGLSFFITPEDRWLVIGSTDNKVLALTTPNLRHPPFILARSMADRSWLDARHRSPPTGSPGLGAELDLVASAASEPPTQDLVNLFTTPFRSWLSPARAVGTRIRFRVPYGTRLIYIANGFVDPERAEAWGDYARVREMDLFMGPAVRGIQLQDRPEFQAVTLTTPVREGQELSLVIRSVYPGRRPEAALNMIIPVILGRE